MGFPKRTDILSRRDALASAGLGFGSLALSQLLAEESTHKPQAAPHFAPRAKSVIFLFMEGGPSHLDSFDPKPLLNRHAGKPLPESYGTVITAMGESRSPLLASRRRWSQHGQSGLWLSDWLPHTASCADHLAVVRSCVADGINHSTGVCQMNTGSILGGRPSLGSWINYALGSLNNNLPSYVVMQDNPTSVVNGPRNWSSGFMPSLHQGTRIESGSEPIANLNRPSNISEAQELAKIGMLHAMNREHAASRLNADLEARIHAYELAGKMQVEAPDALDTQSESSATKRLYGLDRSETRKFGSMCLLARRLVERGVRFVQLYSGAGSKWDAHAKIESNHAKLFRETDLPVAGLLKDLHSRGLLEETLVIWGGEFGRTPMSEKGDGRDHNPTGFSMWMAGGGVKGGQTIGATDDFGLHAVQDRLHVHDLHATILWLLGLENLKVTYHHKGRPENPTLNEGVPYTRIAG
jgi:hypothetical protein